MKVEKIILLLAFIGTAAAGFFFYSAARDYAYGKLCEQNIQKIEAAVNAYNLIHSPENYFDSHQTLDQTVLVKEGLLPMPLDCPSAGMYLIKNKRIICTVHNNEN